MTSNTTIPADGPSQSGWRPAADRNGHDWSPRYPLIVEAVNQLKARSCLIDGEAVACDENGLAVFEQLRRKPAGKHVFFYAFDLLELDGQDLRRGPLETRKATLASLLRRSLPGLRLNEHLAHDGESVFRHACKMGLEGIVSKRLVALLLRPIEGLAEVQEPGSASGGARGRRRLGQVTRALLLPTLLLAAFAQLIQPKLL